MPISAIVLPLWTEAHPKLDEPAWTGNPATATVILLALLNPGFSPDD